MNKVTKELVLLAVLTKQRNTLASIALDSLCAQYIVQPLQKAWRRKDHTALRAKYICERCKWPIYGDTNRFICRYCKYKQKYIEEESRRLDSFP